MDWKTEMELYSKELFDYEIVGFFPLSDEQVWVKSASFQQPKEGNIEKK